MDIVSELGKYSVFTSNLNLEETRPLTFPSGYFYKIIFILGQTYTLVRSYIDPVFANVYASEIIEYKNSIITTHEYKNSLEISDCSEFIYWSLLRGDWSTFMDVATKNCMLTRNYLIEITLKHSAVYRAKMLIKSDVSNSHVTYNFKVWPLIKNLLPLPEKGIVTHCFLNAVMKMKLFTEGYLLQKTELILYEVLYYKNKESFSETIKPIVKSWIANNDLQEQIMNSGQLVFVLNDSNKSPLLDTNGMFDNMCDIVFQKYELCKKFVNNRKIHLNWQSNFEELVTQSNFNNKITV